MKLDPNKIIHRTEEIYAQGFGGPSDAQWREAMIRAICEAINDATTDPVLAELERLIESKEFPRP